MTYYAVDLFPVEQKEVTPEIVREHAAHLTELNQAGKLILAGRFLEDANASSASILSLHTVCARIGFALGCSRAPKAGSCFSECLSEAPTAARAITERKERAADFRAQLLFQQHIRRGSRPTFGVDSNAEWNRRSTAGDWMDQRPGWVPNNNAPLWTDDYSCQIRIFTHE